MIGSLFDSIDDEKKGQIDFITFCEWIINFNNNASNHQEKTAFEMYDLNKDNKITSDELLEIEKNGESEIDFMKEEFSRESNLA